MSSFANEGSPNLEGMPNQDGTGPAEPEFKFRNIGPISEAELSLGGLTVIAGRNNTGKTYLVYTLYGFLKGFRQVLRFPLELSPEFMGVPSPVDDIEEILQSSGQVSYPMSEEGLADTREALLGYAARSFSDAGLATVFSTHIDSFKDGSIEVGLPFSKPPSSAQHEIQLSGGGVLSILYDGRDILASLDPFPYRRPVREIKRRLAWFFVDILLKDLPSEPFILSAERYGISLFYRELDFTKNRLVELLQSIGDEKARTRITPFTLIEGATSRYAQPIKDNIDYTRSIPDLKGLRSEFYDDKYFDEIKEMMDGYYSSAEGDIRFVSKARGMRRFNIPLYLASSSARGLSDLYFFLRHVARKDQLIIIDEPESHLDTTNQREMARLLARCVRAGIRVLITTHSDYLIKEFNNLIMLGNGFENREGVAKKLGYSADEYLPQESVRAYVAEEKTLKRCVVDRFGMDMPVFDESIDEINRVANELSSRVEEIV